MIDAPLALALTTGVVAAFNPCGFAMLPAYLTYFVGASSAQADQPVTRRLLRAAMVGAAVTAGFVVVFGAIGFVVSEVSSSVMRVAPWISVVIGLVLAALGVAMVRGFEPSVGLPSFGKNKVGTARKGDSILTMFIYGVSYAVVSLGCTLPVFLAIVVSNFSTSDPAAGVALFVTYALGMGLVVVWLSIAVALAQRAVVRNLRRVLPYINRVSGALLVVVGLYVALYGWVEIRLPDTTDNRVRGGSIVDRVTGWSSTISSWVQRHLDTYSLLALLVVLLGIIAAAWYSERRGTANDAVP